MPLVQAKCTNCGANLEVENTKDAAICPFCGTPYVVEKAVNNYNTVNHITGNIVNVYGGNSADFVIRAGILERYNGAMSDVVIPNIVTSIGEMAFDNCKGMKSVSIPGSVTSIGRLAFHGCIGLTNVTIPGSVTSIGLAAFLGCTELTSVTISDGVTHIGAEAFSNCIKLTSISLPDSLVDIDFDQDHASFLDSLVDIGVDIDIDQHHVGRTFSGCKLLTDVMISDAALQRLCPDYTTQEDWYHIRHYKKWIWPAFEGRIDHDDSWSWDDTDSSEWYLELKRQKNDEIPHLNRQLWMEQGACSYCGGRLESGFFTRTLKCCQCHKPKDY